MSGRKNKKKPALARVLAFKSPNEAYNTYIAAIEALKTPLETREVAERTLAAIDVALEESHSASRGASTNPDLSAEYIYLLHIYSCRIKNLAEARGRVLSAIGSFAPSGVLYQLADFRRVAARTAKRARNA